MKEPLNTTRDIARELARKYSTMTHDELDILESVLVPHKVPKGDFVLKEGEVSDCIIYIDRGLLREFYIKNGKEVTEHLAVEGAIMMSIESLFREEPSKLQIEGRDRQYEPGNDSGRCNHRGFCFPGGVYEQPEAGGPGGLPAGKVGREGRQAQ